MSLSNQVTVPKVPSSPATRNAEIHSRKNRRTTFLEFTGTGISASTCLETSKIAADPYTISIMRAVLAIDAATPLAKREQALDTLIRRTRPGAYAVGRLRTSEVKHLVNNPPDRNKYRELTNKEWEEIVGNQRTVRPETVAGTATRLARSQLETGQHSITSHTATTSAQTVSVANETDTTQQQSVNSPGVSVAGNASTDSCMEGDEKVSVVNDPMDIDPSDSELKSEWQYSDMEMQDV